MRGRDTLRFAVRAVVANKLRGALTLLAMAIGVASVVVLTGLGDSARRFVLDEFRSLGTNLLVVLPGRADTSGGPPPVAGETPRDLTLDDAYALLRCRTVRKVVPLNFGSAFLTWGGKERETTILGATHEFLSVRNLAMQKGEFLPPGDPRAPAPVCVLGPTLRREIFGSEEAVGQWLRIGDRRFRVLGVLSARGRSLNFDLDEIAVIPVASAQALFNTFSLFRIIVEARSRNALAAAAEEIRGVVRARHEGEDDVTVITQDAVVATFDKVLKAMTLTVAGIASISLAVAGILIMNVMLVAVSQRRAEIGLLKALGAPPRAILRIFLCEAACLSLCGALVGLAGGHAAVAIVRRAYPKFPFAIPLWAAAAGFAVAVSTGLIFALLPARRAARLDPVLALARR